MEITDVIDKEFANELGWNCRLLIVRDPEKRLVMMSWFKEGALAERTVLTYPAFAMLGQVMLEAQDAWGEDIVTSILDKEKR